MSQPARSLSIALAASQVFITFETAVASQQVLRGKTPEEAVKLVGLVHNLCAQAHRAAACAATGLPVAREAAPAVMLEILREHLVVLCRSAPPLLGLPPVALPIAFSRLGAAFAPEGAPMRDSLSRVVFGVPSGAVFSVEAIKNGSILGPFFRALAAHEQALGLEARDIALPSDPTFFARIARDEGFMRPEGCGPLSERLLGRLFEAHRLFAAFGTPAEEDYAPRLVQAGVAKIAAARGMLVHRASLEDGVISAYAIETPTAAMLDAAGPLQAFLEGLAQAPQADEALLRLALLAFDPCVPYALALHDAPSRRMADA
jgi:uptake hydrogenase large subunit